MDRLSVERKHNDKTIVAIDKRNFLYLGNKDASRTDLFMFAVALGVKEQKRTPLSSIVGIIQASVITKDSESMAYLHSIAVSELRKSCEEEKIGDLDTVFTIAQEFANTGFYILEEWLDSGMKEDDILWLIRNDVEDMQDEISIN